MKNFKTLLFLTIVSLLLFTSCNKDDDTSDNSDTEENTVTPEVVITATETCFISDLSIQENSTVTIDCLLDLEGQTLTIPSGVTFEFDGGDVFNGTLNFSSTGKIDGELLSSELTIEGDVSLTGETFNFYPERWDIIEGEVDRETAISNSTIIQDLVIFIANIGGEIFEINKLDAYFQGSGAFKYNILMPSDFHLKMSDETHLRTFPAPIEDGYSTFLIMILNAENVKVTGGYLHGDRDLYNQMDGLPLSHTMKIKTGNNVLIDGVHMSNATQDGLAIENFRFTFDPDYVGSKNITISNCIFDSNRRIKFTITDGQYITVEDCSFIDGGIDTEKSDARAPSCNVNIEPHRERDDEGELKEYQRVSHVTFRENTFSVRDDESNPKAGGLLISHGNGPIVVENNTMTYSGVSFHTVDGVIIRNNKITNASISGGSSETHGRTDFVFDNEIYENNVITDGTALNIAGNGVIARDNILEGTVGIAIGPGSTDSSKGASNITIKNNEIKANSRGIRSLNTMENVIIEDNVLTMLSGATWSFALNNEWSDESTEANFIVKGNVVTGVKSDSDSGAPPSLFGANSITVTENKLGDVQINGGRNINIYNNEIDANVGEHGILFYEDPMNSNFTENNITIYPSKTPLNVNCVRTDDDITLSESVNIEDNSCIEK